MSLVVFSRICSLLTPLRTSDVEESIRPTILGARIELDRNYGVTKEERENQSARRIVRTPLSTHVMDYPRSSAVRRLSLSHTISFDNQHQFCLLFFSSDSSSRVHFSNVCSGEPSRHVIDGTAAEDSEVQLAEFQRVNSESIGTHEASDEEEYERGRRRHRTIFVHQLSFA